jgi:hypothetical protein
MAGLLYKQPQSSREPSSLDNNTRLPDAAHIVTVDIGLCPELDESGLVVIFSC